MVSVLANSEQPCMYSSHDFRILSHLPTYETIHEQGSINHVQNAMMSTVYAVSAIY